jgi:hypothetical protein
VSERLDKTTLPSGFRVLRAPDGDLIVCDDRARGESKLYFTPDDVRELVAFAGQGKAGT